MKGQHEEEVEKMEGWMLGPRLWECQAIRQQSGLNFVFKFHCWQDVCGAGNRKPDYTDKMRQRAE
jgi:hypothetical protein